MAFMGQLTPRCIFGLERIVHVGVAKPREARVWRRIALYVPRLYRKHLYLTGEIR